MKINRKLLVMSFVLCTIGTLANAQKTVTGFKMPALNPKSKLAGLTGNHVAIRFPNYTAAVKWYTEKLDFRVIHEWPFADEKLAYLAPANSNAFWIEILGGGKMQPIRSYKDLSKSLEKGGYHHICLDVSDVDGAVAELRKRGVTIVAKTFYVADINRKVAFVQDPWGNFIELAEVVRK